MADKFGGLTLPVPLTDPLIGDPAIYYLGHYLAAVLNARGQGAWKKIMLPNAAVGVVVPVVKAVHFHDPNDGQLNEADLPALYVIRGEPSGEIWADEWEIERSTVTVKWVLPTSAQEVIGKAHPFANAITKLIRAAIEAGRHPSYVIPGDVDPIAATTGSFVYGEQYINPVSVDFKNARMSVLAIRMSDGPMRAYPALDVKLVLCEVSEEAIDGFAVQDELDLNTKNEEGDVTVDGLLTD